MQCVINRNHLARSVEFAGQFTYTNAYNPITELMKLSFSHDSVVISAYNGESQTEIKLTCNCDAEVDVCVNAARLVKILKACDNDHLELDVELDDGDEPVLFTIKNFDDEFQLPVAKADLPSLPSVSQYHITLPTGLLTRAISFVVSTDEDMGRYALMGVWFNFKLDSIELAATDGRRLMYYNTPFATHCEQSIIIPSAALKKLGKLGDCEISFNENMFRITSDNVTVAGRLVEGRYPNVHKVIEPTNETPEARREIDRTLLLNSLKRAMLMAKDGDWGMDVKASGRRLILSTASVDTGKAKVCIDCEGEWGGANFDITLDIRFVQQMVSELTSDVVEFHYFSEQGACTFNGDGVKCVLMPMSRDVPKKKVAEEEATA
jgi:DNA polymerase III beta subunit